MYQCGDGALDAGSRGFKQIYKKSIRFNAEYSTLFESKVQHDWLTAFFFSFGGCSLSKDFNTFVEYLNRMYLHTKFDKHCSDHGSEPFELSLVRETILTLTKLCEQCDEREADEECYIPIKFFMLSCMAREIFLEKEILKQTNENNQAVALAFFPYIKKMINLICTGDFKEFNSKYMVEQFLYYCMIQYCGLNLEGEAFKITVDRTNGIYNPPPTFQVKDPNGFNPTPTPRNTFGVPPTPRSSFNSSSPVQTDGILGSSPVAATRKRKIQDILAPTGSNSEATGTTERDENKATQSYTNKNLQQTQSALGESAHVNKRRKGHATLPEMYELNQTSAQMEALSKRTASISYYATVCLIINYLVDHVHGVGLPRGLRYTGPTRIEDLSK